MDGADTVLVLKFNQLVELLYAYSKKDPDSLNYTLERALSDLRSYGNVDSTSIRFEEFTDDNA